MVFFKKQVKQQQQDSPSSTVKINEDQGNDNRLQGQQQQQQEEKFERFLPGDPIPQPGRYLVKQLAILAIMLAFDIGVPLALYYGLRDRIGLLYSLIIAGVPPVLWVLYKLIWKRVIDGLGVVLALSFILSGVVSLVTGDARAAILRDSAVAAVVGGLFLITLVPIKTKWFVNRPLTYIMAQSMFSEAEYVWIDREGNVRRQNVVEFQWDVVRYFRISMYTQTAAWGIILIAELVASVVMIKSDMETSRIVDVNNIISNAVIGVMVPLSILAAIYGRRAEKRIGDEWAKENDFTAKYRPEYAHENERAQSPEEVA